MSEVCKDTEIGTKLTLLPGEELQDRTSNNSNKASVDIRTQGFWERRAADILRLMGFRSERMSLLQQVPVAVLCYV